MYNTTFFSTTQGGPAKIWASGSAGGSWSEGMGAPPTPVGVSVPIGGGGLNATFTVKTFDTTTGNPTSGKWLATVTNGAGTIGGSPTAFRGAAAGIINTGAKTFSGTAAGVAKAMPPG
jgi:hypothetical protein